MTERADAARNRQAILAAAARLIWQRGDATVSVDEIAAEAGVGKGTVFRRFGDRQGLLRALHVEWFGEQQRALLDRSRDPRRPAAELLAELVDGMFGMVLARRPLLRAVERTAGSYCTSEYTAWITRLAELLRAARPEADAEFLAHAITAAMRSDLLDHLLDEAGMSPDRVRAGVVELALGAPTPDGDLVHVRRGATMPAQSPK